MEKTNIRFYTMMENLENIHLVKDVGMIPYMLGKFGYCNPVLVSYGRKREEFSYLDKTVALEIRPRYTGNNILDGVLWLLKHAKGIEVLNLYHYKQSTFIWSMVYKAVNPDGKVYVKLDIDPSEGKKMKMEKYSVKYYLTKKVLGNCACVSCETKSFQKYANRAWPVSLEYIPNGVKAEEICLEEKKEKIILTVGRLGSKQKATELLLEAFVKAFAFISKDWRLVLAGPAEEDFMRRLHELEHRDSEAYHNITYVGELKDRKALHELYAKATIFTMPSRWEGFCLVGLEALSKGDYLLTTNLESFVELSNYGEFGAYFGVDDMEEYSNKIVELTAMFDSGYRMNHSRVSSYMRNTYCYDKICTSLMKALGIEQNQE